MNPQQANANATHDRKLGCEPSWYLLTIVFIFCCWCENWRRLWSEDQWKCHEGRPWDHRWVHVHILLSYKFGTAYILQFFLSSLPLVSQRLKATFVWMCMMWIIQPVGVDNWCLGARFTILLHISKTVTNQHTITCLQQPASGKQTIVFHHRVSCDSSIMILFNNTKL